MLKEYKIIKALSDKCEMFFAHRILGDFRLISSRDIQIKEKYICEFIDLLMGKKIVLYGAGIVGQSIYEQLTNFENIEIIGWMDHNYRNIQSPYRNIGDPVLINTLEFDYVVIAVKKENMAEKIIDYLSQMNIDRKLILWKPYPRKFSFSMT